MKGMIYNIINIISAQEISFVFGTRLNLRQFFTTLNLWTQCICRGHIQVGILIQYATWTNGLLTSNILDYWSVNKWKQVEYWIGFSCNNMATIFDYQILAIRFVVKLKMCKNSNAIFSCCYSINGYEIRRIHLAPWSASPPEYDPWSKYPYFLQPILSETFLTNTRKNKTACLSLHSLICSSLPYLRRKKINVSVVWHSWQKQFCRRQKGPTLYTKRLENIRNKNWNQYSFF